MNNLVIVTALFLFSGLIILNQTTGQEQWKPLINITFGEESDGLEELNQEQLTPEGGSQFFIPNENNDPNVKTLDDVYSVIKEYNEIHPFAPVENITMSGGWTIPMPQVNETDKTQVPEYTEKIRESVSYDHE